MLFFPDYSLAYFTTDGFLILVSILVIWKLNARPQDETDGNVSKKVVTAWDVTKEITTVPMLIMIFGVTIIGLAIGVQATFLYLYLQNELGASSALISYYTVVTYACQALFLLISDKVINVVGCMNSVAVNIFSEAIKLTLYAYIDESPPYFALGVHVMNCALWGYSWVAMLKYGFQITPPHLVGTMTAIVTVFLTVLCKFCIKLIRSSALYRVGT